MAKTKADKRLADGEQVVHDLHQHWVKLVGPAVLLVLTVGLGGFLAALAAQQWLQLVIGLAVLVVVLFWVLRPFLRWYTTTYTLTDRRLLIRSGVLSKSGHDLPLRRVTDVAFRHSLWQRMYGAGTLILESAGEQGQVVLTAVPSVQDVYRDLYEILDPDTDSVDKPHPRRRRQPKIEPR
ncbi:MAG: PH domain-containing protein [Streptosporangiales bacterium]|nr:PH domain-containing protein [Streptosporangiales bacterium]MBO0890981.1 PH domain-containing protein [Acidothermales bacterium]